MANRINKNLRWVKRQLDLAKLTDVLEEEIIDAFNRVEDEIAEVYGALKSTKAITLDGVTESFTISPLEHVTSLTYPSTYSMMPEWTADEEKYNDVKRQITTGTSPRIVLIRGGSAYFWPMGTSGDVITLFGFALPTTDQVEGTGDPAADRHWDMAYRYGALHHLIGGDWTQKYKDEMASQGHSTFVADGPVTIGKNDSMRKLGF